MTLNYSIMLARRWAWMVILGIVLCSGAGYGISKISHPVYQASVILILNLGVSTSAYENFTTSVQAVPTYALLITDPSVLDPVIEQHPGLTLDQLKAMIDVKPQSNTQLIELDVKNGNAQLASDLANEVAQSFTQFSQSRLPATVQYLPAQVPVVPVSPKTSVNTGIGALVGLGLALALIVIFEWLDDRLKGIEEAQELLGSWEILTVMPWLSRKQRTRRAHELPALAERYRILCSDLDVAQKVKPFKSVMVTSTLDGEGKSSIAINLAYFLAIAGKHVLLVDADLRYPTLDQYFELEKRLKLASGFIELREEIDERLDGQLSDFANLCVLTAEALPPNFTDFLLSPGANRFFEHFQKAPYDYVIFDTPPLLPAAETQVLASHVEAVVLVVDPSKTPRKLLVDVKQLLNRTHTRVLGVVINKSRWIQRGEIRRHLKDRRSYRAAPPALIKPPETPYVNDLWDQEAITVKALRVKKPD